MEKKKIIAHIAENGKSDYAVTITVSGYTIDGDEPSSFGGGDTGPAPYDMLLAALGECTAMTVRWYAKQQKWPLEKVEVVMTHIKENRADITELADKKGPPVDVFEKKVILHGDQLTEEQRAKLIEVSAKCPVQKTLQSGVVIRTLNP